MLWAVVLLPALGAGAALLARRRPGAVAAAVLTALAATLAAGAWAAAGEATAAWSWRSPASPATPALPLQLAATGFAGVMVVLVPAVALPVVGYAAVTEEAARARLLALMTAFVGAMELLVLATGFLTLLVGWELVAAASWGLITHHASEPANPRAATQAFVATRAGDLGLYVAAGLTFAATGSFAFAGLSGLEGGLLHAVAAGVLLAAAAKSAQLPFSPWLFSAVAGPSPVSALLHSATLVAAGAYVLIRLAPALSATVWFLPTVGAIGLATALGGGVVAFTQTHVKRVLAGSTSAQYGLMFVAVAAGSTAAAGAHLVAHALLKSLLFLAAGVAIRSADSSQLDDLRLGSSLRSVAALSAVGALALAAVPPLGAAWSKELIVAAAKHASSWLAAGVLVAGLLSAAYAARFQLLAFGPRPAAAPRLRHPSAAALAGLAGLAAATLALSVLWLPAASSLAQALLPGALPTTAPWETAAGLGSAIVAFALVGVLLRRGSLTGLGLPDRLHAEVADWLGLPRAARGLVTAPVLALAGALARVDDRVVDAGVRGTSGLVAWLSRLTARRGEWSAEGLVHAVVQSTLRTAAGSRVADDRGVDWAVEAGARGVGVAGARARRLQTGLSHHYYLVVGAGLVLAVVVVVVLR